MDIVDVFCIENTDPHYICIIVAGQLPIQLPATIYEQIKDRFGFPDVVCGQNDNND